jgi:hypothetical protein
MDCTRVNEDLWELVRLRVVSAAQLGVGCDSNCCRSLDSRCGNSCGRPHRRMRAVKLVGNDWTLWSSAMQL